MKQCYVHWIALHLAAMEGMPAPRRSESVVKQLAWLDSAQFCAVATSTSARPSTKASIAFSSSASGICPWATATRASGTRRCALRDVARQRLVDAVEELLVAVGLGDEVHGAGPYRPHGDVDVGVGADEHDREAGAHRGQALLELRSAHVRHAHVEHEAPWRRRIELWFGRLDPQGVGRARLVRDDGLADRLVADRERGQYENGQARTVGYVASPFELHQRLAETAISEDCGSAHSDTPFD